MSILKKTLTKYNADIKQRMVKLMATAKEVFLDLIEQQPDDSSYDDLLQELALIKMINAGLADVDSGNIISNEEIKDVMSSW